MVSQFSVMSGVSAYAALLTQVTAMPSGSLLWPLYSLVSHYEMLYSPQISIYARLSRVVGPEHHVSECRVNVNLGKLSCAREVDDRLRLRLETAPNVFPVNDQTRW